MGGLDQVPGLGVDAGVEEVARRANQRRLGQRHGLPAGGREAERRPRDEARAVYAHRLQEDPERLVDRLGIVRVGEDEVLLGRHQHQRMRDAAQEGREVGPQQGGGDRGPAVDVVGVAPRGRGRPPQGPARRVLERDLQHRLERHAPGGEHPRRDTQVSGRDFEVGAHAEIGGDPNRQVDVLAGAAGVLGPHRAHREPGFAERTAAQQSLRGPERPRDAGHLVEPRHQARLLTPAP